LKSRGLALFLLFVGGCLPEPGKREPAPSVDASDADVVDTAAIAHATAGPVASGPVAVARSEFLLQLDCLTCHDELLLRQQRLSARQWRAIVGRMRTWGAQVPDRDVEGLSRFLEERFGPDAGAFEPSSIRKADYEAKIAPLPDEGFGGGDPARGKIAFRKYCIDCHGADARGGSLGIRLVDSPLLGRAPDIVKTVRSGRGRMGAIASIEDGEIRDIIAHLRGMQRSDSAR